MVLLGLGWVLGAVYLLFLLLRWVLRRENPYKEVELADVKLDIHQPKEAESV
jgi:hypothetical protein